LSGCKLSWRGCETLGTIISSRSCLRELNVSNNDLQDAGVQSLSGGLENPQCKLETLRLSGCQITEEGCSFLATALSTNPSHLKELDLSYNHPGVSGVNLLSSGVKHKLCRLESLRVENCGERRLQLGLKKYGCVIEFDPNTAHRNIQLSDNNKKVTVVREEQPYPDHPDRFDHCCWQVLGKTGLSGRCYWEVKREGPVIIAVSYKRISRKGPTADCRLGWNDQCWSLVCTEKQYSFWHNKKETVYPLMHTSIMSSRVGVYVDVPAGIVSFYSAGSSELHHLHTFQATFTAPLYPAFGFGFGYWSYDSSVSLCEVGLFSVLPPEPVLCGVPACTQQSAYLSFGTETELLLDITEAAPADSGAEDVEDGYHNMNAKDGDVEDIEYIAVDDILNESSRLGLKLPVHSLQLKLDSQFGC
ncbi:hypothetical protein AMECASPLE_014428, partial [Ameca splendens]